MSKKWRVEKSPVGYASYNVINHEGCDISGMVSYEIANTIVSSHNETLGQDTRRSILDEGWVLSDDRQSIFRESDFHNTIVYVYQPELSNAIAALPDAYRALQMVVDVSNLSSQLSENIHCSFTSVQWAVIVNALKKAGVK